MKRVFIVFVVAIAVVMVSSCSKEDTKDKKVVVFLPTSESIERWKMDKQYLSEALGSINIDYSIMVVPEVTGAEEQVEQITEAIKDGIKTLVITPIDYNQIVDSKILDGMDDLNIICYDRMIYNCKEVDFYSSCDNKEVGEMQASFLLQSLASSGRTSMNLEMLAGPSSDINSKEFFDGAWSLLKSFVDDGNLIIPSGKSSYDDVAMDIWDEEEAEAIMTDRLNKYYPDGSVPDMILAPNDIAAIGVVRAIEKHNPSLSVYPVITGQDNSEEARDLIKEGKISMTIDKSIKDLAYNTVNVVSLYLNGAKPLASTSFDNGIKSVPFLAISPKIVTKANL